MSAVEIFTKVASTLKEKFMNDVKLKTLSKSDVLDIIRINTNMHKSICSCIKVGTDQERNSWYNAKVKPALAKSTSSCKDIYYDYASGLTGKAKSMEDSVFLESIYKINDEYIDLLKEINKNIDKFFEREKVDIYDTRMTQMAILGFLKDDQTVADFSLFLYSFIIKTATGAAKEIPRYRDEFLKANVTKVAMLANNVIAHKGAYEFLDNADRIRSRGADLILGANKDFSFGNFAIRQFYTSDFLDSLLSALSCLNIFRIAGDAIADYKIERNNRNKEIKEWLENHVALLRMDLMNADKSSKEYAKLEKVIEAYDEKITEYDEKIKEFEEGD